MSLFGIPPGSTYLVVTVILFVVVITGQYWTFEKLTLFFCVFNLVYIPAAFWAMKTPTAPGWGAVAQGFLVPSLAGGLTRRPALHHPGQHRHHHHPVADLLPAERRGGQGPGHPRHQVRQGRHLRRLALTCLVAAFIIIATGAAFYYHHPPIVIEDAQQTAEALVPLLPHGQGELARKLFAIGLFDAGFLGALCISLSTSWAVGEVFGWAHSLNKSVRDAPWFYVVYLLMLLSGRGRGADPRGAAHHDHHVRAGGGGHAPARRPWCS